MRAADHYGQDEWGHFYETPGRVVHFCGGSGVPDAEVGTVPACLDKWSSRNLYVGEESERAERRRWRLSLTAWERDALRRKPRKRVRRSR